MKPGLEHERELGYPGAVVVGIDEVGRGCLAGPVVAGAVALAGALPEWTSEIADSKLLKPAVRERLAPLIESWALAWAIGVASVEEIDRINIYHASLLAMRRAALAVAEKLRSVGQVTSHILIDGNAIPLEMPAPCVAVIQGDRKCLSVAAASVVAKVWRDREMRRYESVYAGYGFGAHKGYSTPAHYEALARLGPCEIHRRSFAPVAERLQSRAP